MSKSVDVPRVQQVLLSMAVSIRDVLDRHDIPYMMAYGTLLGAVWHKGFIPWDDDLDFYLFDDSYERAIQYLREELPADYYMEEKDVLPLKKYQFQNEEFYGPNDADAVLTTCYGDYMRLPPEENRVCHYSSVEFL